MKKLITSILIVTVFISMAVPAYADNPFMYILREPAGKLHTIASYDYTYYGKADVRDQNTDFGMQQHDGTLMLPLIKQDNYDFSMYTTFRYVNWDTDAKLSNLNASIPNNMYSLNFMPTYRYMFDNGWMLGVSGQIGSASNKLFNTYDEWVLGGRVFLKIPSGERNYWVVLVDYSSNREFLRHVPLPGAGYMYNPNDDLQIFAGFPFAFIRYSPVERVKLSFSYLPIHTINAKASYEFIDKWFLFADFDWHDQRYYRTGREDKKARIFYYEKKAGGGIYYAPNRGMLFQVKGGYSFDRYIYEAKKYHTDHRTMVHMDGAYYVEAKARIAF